MSWQTLDPKQKVLDEIMKRGGWVNSHSHIDRAYILNEDNFKLVDGDLKQKWQYPDKFKKQATVDDIYANMEKVIENMLAQNVQAIGTFIDVDPVIGDKAIQAADRLKSNYSDKIEIKFINQVVKGVIDPEARKWFEIGAEFADIIGGLPEKDEGHEAEHLDVLFEIAKRNGNKPLHVHVDQLNLPTQRDTELLVQKTIEHGYEGKVVAIHCISVAAQPKAYRLELYRKIKDAGITIVACPAGWIDNSWVAGLDEDVIGPIHNAVTPVKEMLAAGVTVALGTDNIRDIYKPFVDGDMWTELRFLIESQRLYNIEALADVSSTNGKKALFT